MNQVSCPYCSRWFDSVAESKDHMAVQHEPLARTIELDPLEITTISRRARTTADTLLDAFYLQDQRESHLIRESVSEAKAAAATARERMVETYEVEFPHIAPSAAQAAGDAFMNALFLHDEIENWEFIRQLLPNDDLEAALLTPTGDDYAVEPVNDPRWDAVADYLRDVCRVVPIDAAYADKQMQFWLLHGQINEYWEELARDAHAIKLRAMLGDGPEELIATLTRYFVAGVKLHDEWSHQYKDRDLDVIGNLVAKYYQKVFEVRTSDQSAVDRVSEQDD